jgi:hypothetical protein
VTRRTALLVVLLAAPIVVVLGSRMAGRYCYGSPAQSQSPSLQAQEPALNTSPHPSERFYDPSMTGDVTVTEEITVLQREGDRKQPPQSTLSYGEREVRSSASVDGSYSWEYRDDFAVGRPTRLSLRRRASRRFRCLPARRWCSVMEGKGRRTR